MRNKGVTLKDIALETGYTINTVSRALKDCSDIALSTREKIKRVADENGYIQNSLASSLRSGKTGIIAIIISDISNPLFGIMVKDIEDQLEKNNYCVIVLNTDENENQEKNAICLALSKMVDGIILCPTQVNDENIRLLQASKKPFVLMGRRFHHIETDYVIWDDISGGYRATEYLIHHGHKDIIFINGPSYVSSARERLEGYKNAYIDNGLTFREEYVKEIKFSSIEVGELMNELIKSEMTFSALLTFNDMIAWNISSELNSRDMQHIEVMGFDNIQSRFRMPYGLSSVNTPKRQMAFLIVETLLKKISNEVQFAIQRVIDVNLCIRK